MCELYDEDFRNVDIQEFPFLFISYNIQTPNADKSGVYPNNQHCSYSIQDRQPGYQYTYIYISPPDIEADITGSSCYDCMEYEHTDEYGSSSELVTCGNGVDGRLSYGAGTISNIALTFKSDGSNGLKGANFYVFEENVAYPGIYYTGKRDAKRGALQSSEVKNQVVMFNIVTIVNSSKFL